jgi:hypothetical protein
MPTYIHIVVCSSIERYIYVWVCWIRLYRLISSHHQSTNKRAHLSQVFHLTILLSMSDHLYMPFIYKVTHIVNEQSSGHHTDRPTAFTSIFLSSYRIGDRLHCPLVGQTGRQTDRQTDDDKEQMNDLDVFGHSCHKRKRKKSHTWEQTLHDNVNLDHW